MKKQLLIATLSMLLSAFCFGQAVDLPVNFENATPNFYALTDFGGNSSEIVVDPADATNHVVKSIKTAIAETWAGTTVGGTVGFANKVPFAVGSTKMSVRVWSPSAGTPIRLKVEDASNAGISVETEANTTVASAWETLVFDFSKQASGTSALNLANTYNKASIFFNFGKSGVQAGVQTYYWDDVTFSGGITPPDAGPTVAAPTPTVNSANVISIFSDAYTDLAGTNFNPNWGQKTVITTEIIAGNKTLKYAGLDYQGTEFTPQNLATMNNVHFDYWTADGTVLKFSLVSKTPAAEKAYTVSPVTKNSWVSVDIPLSTFTAQGLEIGSIYQFKFEGNGTVFLDNLYFSGGATTPENDASLSNLSINGTTITGFSADMLTYTYELDRGTTVVPTVTATSTQTAASVVITAAAGIPGTSTVVVTAKDGTTKRTYSVAFTEILSLPINFEAGTYPFIDFDGGVATVISNPKSSGINTSATVAKIVRNGGATWGGSKIILSHKLDFSTAAIISMKVYSERAGVPVLFKLEGDAQTELSVNTTVANQWETLTWDFTGKPSNTYNTLVFMFDFGTLGDGSANSTFLFDDIQLIAGLAQISLPVTFDAATVNYKVTDFGGNSTVLGADPANSGNTVAITTKTAGAETWAGTTIGTATGFASAIPFTAGSTKMSVRVWSPTAGTPIRLKVEDASNAAISVETEVNTTVASAWETLVFDFSNQASGTAAINFSNTYNKASIFFNFGKTGVQAGEQTYYWDNVTFGMTVGLQHLNAASNNVVVYPNPAENNLFFTSKTALSKVAIYNVVGTQVKEYGNVLQSLNVSDLKSGVYILRLTDTNGKTVSSKFIKK
jgi:hypothetical protein